MHRADSNRAIPGAACASRHRARRSRSASPAYTHNGGPQTSIRRSLGQLAPWQGWDARFRRTCPFSPIRRRPAPRSTRVALNLVGGSTGRRDLQYGIAEQGGARGTQPPRLRRDARSWFRTGSCAVTRKRRARVPEHEVGHTPDTGHLGGGRRRSRARGDAAEPPSQSTAARPVRAEITSGRARARAHQV